VLEKGALRPGGNEDASHATKASEKGWSYNSRQRVRLI